MKLAAFLAASVSADVLETEETFNKEIIEELTDGDIKGNFGPFFNKHTRSAIRSDFVRWPSSTNYVRVPFEMHNEMPIVARGIAQDAQRNYALRTCIDLQPWQGEEDYIYITQSGGCWSYIGWAYNGGQQLSIGERCTTQSGTFQHEFMHALGIFHEQSRPDRDTYVEINEENIQNGTLNNFNKYDFNYVDIKDVPYDYESVMHYGARGFAIDPDEDTIIAKIPYFSKVIGQRKDFSRGDVQKINNMYECSIPLRNSYSSDFTEMNWGGFVNEPVDNPDLSEGADRIDWRQYDVSKAELVGDRSYHGENGHTAPKTRKLVFPDSDQSDGRLDHGRYLALNGSWFEGDDHTGKTGVLQSKQFTTKTKEQCLEIWSNIKSADSNNKITVEIWESDDRFGEVVGRFPLQRFTINADEQQRWESNRWTIEAPERFKVLITSTLASDEDVIVVDDISVLDKTCESHSWPIYGFQKLYDEKEKGEYVTSEMMTAPTGHKFKLRFYPKGHPDSDGTYASLFLHLHESSNDIEGLKWPMTNQYLKFIVQDQISDVVNRMDQNRIRSTEILGSDPGPDGIWGMVTDADHEGLSVNSSAGYQTMIPLFDLFEASYSYIKHDMVMLMLDMRDLSHLDTSSKLDRCLEQCPMSDEWFNEGVSCLPDKENAGQYSCQCRKPFIESMVDGKVTCTCPEGYEYNPNAINEEVERLTCFSLCDFPETNPCDDFETCEQTSAGAVCNSENETKKTRSGAVEEMDVVVEEDLIFGYTDLEFGLAIALGVVSAMLVMMTVFAFMRPKETRQNNQSCESNPNPAFKPF